jgi:hypothetical protein
MRGNLIQVFPTKLDSFKLEKAREKKWSRKNILTFKANLSWKGRQFYNMRSNFAEMLEMIRNKFSLFAYKQETIYDID